MDMTQVRDMVISMASYQASLKSFVQERINENIEIANNDPFLLIMATPIYLGTENCNPLQKEYRDLLEIAPGVPDNQYNGLRIGKSYPRIYGIEIVPYERPINGIFNQYSRLFRNGHLEYYEKQLPDPDVEWPKKPMPIYSYRIAVILLHFLIIAQRVYEISEITDPITINLLLGNAASSFILYNPRSRYYGDERYIWDHKLLSVDMTVNDIDKSNIIASDLMDRFFNAYGYEKNLHFNIAKELLIIR